MVTNVPRYGNCYSFNTVYEKEQEKAMGTLQSSIAGPSFGLNIILALDQRNYMKNGVTEQVSKFNFYERHVISFRSQSPMIDSYANKLYIVQLHI